jgi:hypothetical protein
MKKIGLVEDYADHFSKLVTFCEHSTLIDKHLRGSGWPVLIQLTPPAYMLRGTAVKIEEKQKEKERDEALQTARETRAMEEDYARNKVASKATHKSRRGGWDNDGKPRHRLNSDSGSRRGGSDSGSRRGGSDSGSRRGGSDSGSRRGGSDSGSRRGGSDSGSNQDSSWRGSASSAHGRGSHVSNDLNVFTRLDDVSNHASMCELLNVHPLPTTLVRPPIFVGWDREGMVLSVRKLTGELFSRS